MPRPIVLFALLASAFSACSYNPPAPVASSRTVTLSPQVSASVSLTATQARLVEAYIADSAPRGRGRNGGLPRGIARNLARGKALPSGIARQYLPASLLSQLPDAPSGLEYLIVAGKLVLVEAATQILRDVLLDTLV